MCLIQTVGFCKHAWQPLHMNFDGNKYRTVYLVEGQGPMFWLRHLHLPLMAA